MERGLLAKAWCDNMYVTERMINTVISRPRQKVGRNAQNPERGFADDDLGEAGLSALPLVFCVPM